MSLAKLRPAAAPETVPTADDLIGRARKLTDRLDPGPVLRRLRGTA